MLEKEIPGYTPKVEVVFTPEQGVPFDVKKIGHRWQLSVNKTHFESKGFSPDEIDGAIHLEEECLIRQTRVSSQEDVEGLRKWQDLASDDPKAVAFKAAFERLTALSSLEEKRGERARLAKKYLEKFASRSLGTDYTDQLFSSVLKTGLGQDETPDTKLVATVLDNLKKQERVEDRDVSALGALISADLSSTARASWFEARFLPRLQFLKYQDALKNKQDEPENESEPQPPSSPSPSEAKDEFEQHGGREEKEKGQPLFIVDPSYTGYWEEDSYDVLDENTGRLTKSDTQKAKTEISTPTDNIIASSKRTISGYSGTNLFALPLAPGFQLTKQGLDLLKSQDAQVLNDSEGHIFIQSQTNIQIRPEIAMSTKPNNAGTVSIDLDISKQKLPDEIADELYRINHLVTDSLGKIQQWDDFIKTSFQHPSDNNQTVTMYSSVDNSASRLEKAVEGKLLDCYLAREFFIAGLKRLDLQNVEWRAVNGHYVAPTTRDGTSHMHTGTAHAWVKIRLDKVGNWIIIDPTPPGDQAHQGEGSIDEFSQLFLQSISQEDLKEMEKEAIAFGQRRTPETEDQYLLEFAREAGISKEEAQKILAVLSNVDKFKDRQGRFILARLKEQFDRIIDEYTVMRQEDLGLIEMSRGRGLEDPVAAFIDIQAGQLDPTGFAKKRLIEEKEQYYGGWDLEVVTDGSGSMTGSLEGRTKYLVQRDISYLLQKGLHRFSQEAQRRKLRLVTPLKIRSSQYIFRGNRIEEIKPLTDEFTPLQMVLLWKKSAENIGGGTPAHLGLQAILDRIPPKEAQLLKDKKLLKVVALISDGGYDDPARVRNLINRLSQINVIVAEFHIADARSLEDLPQNVAERVIEAARLLMPERVRK